MLYALVLALMPMSGVLAVDGVVTDWLPDCTYFVVETDSGFAAMEWNGATQVGSQDRLVGNFAGGAMNVLRNETKGALVKVWIEDYPVPRDEALEIFRAECN